MLNHDHRSVIRRTRCLMQYKTMKEYNLILGSGVFIFGLDRGLERTILVHSLPFTSALGFLPTPSEHQIMLPRIVDSTTADRDCQ